MALAIPLPILLGLIVGGIGGTVWVLYRLGWAVPVAYTPLETHAASSGGCCAPFEE